MRKLDSFLRYSAGRKSVPSHYKNHMKVKSQSLEGAFKLDIIQFEVRNDMKEERPVVWGDAEEPVDAVFDNRNFVGDYVIKIMADGGQGFFKICLPIFPPSTESKDSSEESLFDNIPAKKKKIDPGNVKVESSLIGVKKLIMLCVVLDIKATHENIKMLFDLTKINNISFKFSSNLKVLLMIYGHQTAISSFPYPYCFASFYDYE